MGESSTEIVNENSKFIRNFIVVFLFSIVVLFFLATIFVVILICVKNDRKLENSRFHKYTEINPFKNSTKNGFVRINRNLDEEEYLTYINSHSGGRVFISSLEGIEYECTGVCYCKTTSFEENSNKNNRRTSNILTHGLFALLTASSAMMAVYMSWEMFQDECLRKIPRWDCDEDDIEADVEDCRTPDEMIEEIDLEDLEFEDDMDNYVYYHCVGDCLIDFPAGEAWIDPEARIKAAEDEKKRISEAPWNDPPFSTLDIENLTNEEIFRVCTDMNGVGHVSINAPRNRAVGEIGLKEAARRKFARINLEELCRVSAKLIIGAEVCMGIPVDGKYNHIKCDKVDGYRPKGLLEDWEFGNEDDNVPGW